MTDSYRLLVRCTAGLGCIPTTAVAIGTPACRQAGYGQLPTKAKTAAAIGTLRTATNKGKNLAPSPVDYPHSSAKFYISGEQAKYEVTNYAELFDVDLTEKIF